MPSATTRVRRAHPGNRAAIVRVVIVAPVVVRAVAAAIAIAAAVIVVRVAMAAAIAVRVRIASRRVIPITCRRS